jgi:hypothetical protein
MNTQTTSIALFNIVIPASEAILSGKDFLGQLRCLRILTLEIAGLLSSSSITADKPASERARANELTKLTSWAYVAVNHGHVPGRLTVRRGSERLRSAARRRGGCFRPTWLPADPLDEILNDSPV